MIDFKKTAAANRLLLACLAAAGVVLAGWDATAQAPLVDHARFHDPKVLPPCAAEGACRPRRATTGFYPTRWRRWPGEATAAASGQGASESILPGIESIDPKLEDREAPEPSETDEALDSAGPSGGSLPPLPPLPPLPGRTPDAEPADGQRGQDGNERPRLPPFPPRARGASVPARTWGEQVAAIPLKARRGQGETESRLAPVRSQLQRESERSRDTPPPLPTNLPRVSNVAWVTSDDGPPALPWRLDTATESALIKANAANGSSASPQARRLPTVQRMDPAVKPIAAQLPAVSNAQRRR